MGGLGILLLPGVGAALLSDNSGPAVFIMLWLSGWSVGTAFLLLQAWSNWVAAFTGPGSRIGNIFSAIFMTIFAVPFTGGLFFGLFIIGTSMSPLAAAPLVLGGI